MPAIEDVGEATNEFERLIISEIELVNKNEAYTDKQREEII